jgi:hypothetical protein
VDDDPLLKGVFSYNTCILEKNKTTQNAQPNKLNTAFPISVSPSVGLEYYLLIVGSGACIVGGT